MYQRGQEANDLVLATTGELRALIIQDAEDEQKDQDAEDDHQGQDAEDDQDQAAAAIGCCFCVLDLLRC